MLASPVFSASERLSRFLRFVVEETLAGRGDRLKEYTIGVEVFDKGPSFDPRTDSSVRSEASKLRLKLRLYHETDGREDPVRIELPKGSYVPEFTSREPAATPARRPVPLWAWAAGAAVLAVAIVATILWRTQRTGGSSPELRFTRLTSDRGLTAFPALSREGRLVAYASDRAGGENLDIWVQPLAGRDPIRLTSDPADDYDPAFSPDGSRIAFRSDRSGGGIWVVPALGGQETLLVPSGRRPKYSPDGQWIAYWTGPPTGSTGQIWVMPAAGGVPRQIQLDISYASSPAWSPDGSHLLFLAEFGPTGGSAMNWDWWVVPAAGGPARKTGVFRITQAQGLMGLGQEWGGWRWSRSMGTAPAAWVAEGVLFSARSGDSTSLYRLKLTPGTWQAQAPAERLTRGAGQEVHAAAARTGEIVFANVQSDWDLWMMPIRGEEGRRTGEPRRLTTGAADDQRPSASADGKYVSFLSTRSGNVDIWLLDVETGSMRPVTATPRDETHPVLAADGSRIVYAIQERKEAIYVVAATGGTPELVCDDCGRPLDWTRDGRRVLFWSGWPVRFFSLDLVSHRRTEVVAHPKHSILRAQFSPDGEWIAFHLPVEPQRTPVFVARLHEGKAGTEKDWIAVTDGTGLDAYPLWSPDGGTLFFLSERDGFLCLWSQALDPTTKHPRGEASEVYHFHRPAASISGQFGGSVTRDRLFFSMAEVSGNLWLATPDEPK
jgi:Tol biopolymer transport system component